MDRADRREVGDGVPSPTEYEAPQVERVLTPAELEREILYAGPPSSDPV
jgi:hypothetical protein